MAWKFVDEAEPPNNADILVWNGEHRVTARRDARGRFIAYSEGCPVRDPFDNVVLVKGVIQWSPLQKAPA
jgi:hypothetical protein